MARISAMVSLSANDENQLRRWEAAQGTPQQVALRCRLILAAAAGKQDLEIAATYGVNRHTAALWRQRVRSEGVAAVWEIQPGRAQAGPQPSQARCRGCRYVEDQTQRYDAVELSHHGQSSGCEQEHGEPDL